MPLPPTNIFVDPAEFREYPVAPAGVLTRVAPADEGRDPELALYAFGSLAVL